MATIDSRLRPGQSLGRADHAQLTSTKGSNALADLLGPRLFRARVRRLVQALRQLEHEPRALFRGEVEDFVQKRIGPRHADILARTLR